MIDIVITNGIKFISKFVMADELIITNNAKHTETIPAQIPKTTFRYILSTIEVADHLCIIFPSDIPMIIPSAVNINPEIIALKLITFQ